MSELFKDKKSFNDDISRLDTIYVTNIESMFEGATHFNQDISRWDTAFVTFMNKILKML